jgi:hypothetical protein
MKGKIAHLWIWLLMALLLSLFTVQLSWAGANDHTWWKISFQTPLAFSSPEKIGLDAAALNHPPESGLGKAQMEITLVGVPKGMAESLGNKDAEILNYVKATFLGAATPATKKVERTFFGKKVAGEAQDTTIPKKGELEIYLIPLSDGDKVALGFVRDAQFPKDKADGVIKAVAQSLKEVKKP